MNEGQKSNDQATRSTRMRTTNDEFSGGYSKDILEHSASMDKILLKKSIMRMEE
jgi:hypothetical protein